MINFKSSAEVTRDQVDDYSLNLGDTIISNKITHELKRVHFKNMMDTIQNNIDLGIQNVRNNKYLEIEVQTNPQFVEYFISTNLISDLELKMLSDVRNALTDKYNDTDLVTKLDYVLKNHLQIS